MIELLDAVRAAIIADATSKAIGIGSSTTVIKLGVGDAADLAPGVPVYFSGVGASVANVNVIRTVLSRDLVLDTITVAALPAAPQAADTVKTGCRNFIIASLAGGDGVYAWDWSPSPVDALLSYPTEKKAVVTIGCVGSARAVLGLTRIVIEVDAFCWSRRWLSALGRSLYLLLHARPSMLSVAGYEVHSVSAGQAELPIRQDALDALAVMVSVNLIAAEG